MRLSLENSRWIIVWLLLVVIITGAALHRVNRYKDRPFYDPQTETGFFYTEEAFQYRYARMIANNEAVPVFDKKAQWPEGMTPFRDLTLFQEYLHGMAFRLFSFFCNHTPPHVFLIYFVSWFSTLAVLAMFLGARALGADEWTALFCSILYAFTGAAFSRVQFYELESTAFPLMALAFVTFLKALRGRRYAMVTAAVSGCLLAAALISWHFTRFYLLVFWASMGSAFLFAGGNRRRAAVATMLLLSAAAVGVLSPVMRNSDFLASPAMMAGVVVMVGLYCDGKYGLNFLYRLSFLLAGAVMIIAALSIGAETEAYGHVWDLLKYKISHLLIKPADPADLPFAGRMLWNGPFNTLSPYLLIYRYGLLLPLALAAVVRFIKQQRHSIFFEDILVIVPAILFLAANIMAQRLTIFGAFFLGLVVVYLFVPLRDKALNTASGQPPVRSFLNGSRLSLIILGMCLVFQVREAVLCDSTFFSRAVWRLFPDHSRSRSVPYTGDQINMLVWIRNNTPEDAVFLSHQGNSPSILTYAGRAINLHPKLETLGLREKYKTILMTLFGEDEEALYRLFDLFETDYYLYPVTNLLQADGDGERYMAGLSKVSRRSLIYRLHFDPSGFRRLRLVYRNRYSQIYQVVDEHVLKKAGAGYVAPYFPAYDLNLFSSDDVKSVGYFDDTRVDDVLDRIVYSLKMMRNAGEYMSRGDRPMTEKSIWQSLAIGLPDAHVYYQAADYMALLANFDQALAYIRKALAYDPENIQFKKKLARIHALRGELDQALTELMAVSQKIPEDVVVYNDMGIVLWKKKEFAVAREKFLRALTLDPDYSRARHNLDVLERSGGP